MILDLGPPEGETTPFRCSKLPGLVGLLAAAVGRHRVKALPMHSSASSHRLHAHSDMGILILQARKHRLPAPGQTLHSPGLLTSPSPPRHPGLPASTQFLESFSSSLFLCPSRCSARGKERPPQPKCQLHRHLLKHVFLDQASRTLLGAGVLAGLIPATPGA